MTGGPILRQDDEMDDLSKPQFLLRVCGPFVDAVLCLPQDLIHKRRIDKLTVQQDLPVKRFTGEGGFLGTDY